MLGGVQYTLYVPIFSRVFPHTVAFSKLPWRSKFKDLKGGLGAAAQVCIDQFLYHPFMYFPAFYTIKELVTKDYPDVYNAVFVEYAGNMREDVTALWKIWLPTTCISFFFLPLWLRIPWSACTSLVWTIVLSGMRGGSDGGQPVLEDGEGLAVISGKSLNLFEADWEDTHIDPVDMDPHLAHTTLTASGLDRKGIVKLISQAIHETGGNVTVSKMNRLGNQFVMMMTVSFDGDKVSKRSMENAVRKAAAGPPGMGKDGDIQVIFNSLKHRSTARRQSEFVTGIKLKVTGPCAPGIVADFATMLHNVGCNIERLDSYNKVKSGQRHFHLHVDAGADREFSEMEIKAIKEQTSALRVKYNLHKHDVGILRRKRVALNA